jgi:DNA repair exonuclease SbcCD ATPase subunit
LKKAGSTRQIKNLSSDISDSEVYTILLNHLAPKVCTKAPMNEKDLTKRAELLLQEADKVKVRKFVAPTDIVEGNGKLNFAFVANIFGSLREISDADRSVKPAPAPAPSRSENVHLETTIARLKKEIEELKSRLAEAEKSQADMAKKYNDQLVENQQLKAKLAQLESALNSKKDGDLNDLKKAIDAASKDKEDLLKRIRELEEQLAALQKKYDALKKENGELVKSLDSAESEIKKLDATVLRLDRVRIVS